MAYYQPGMRWTAQRANRWATQRVWQAEDLVMTDQVAELDTDIRIPVEAGGEYEYKLMISYSADPGGNTAMAARWLTPQGVSIHRFPLSHPSAGPSGLNGGGTVILRRPASTTHQIIGGSSSTNYHSARDEGAIDASSEGVLIWRVRQSGDGSSTPTTLRGGPAHTQVLWRRIN